VPPEREVMMGYGSYDRTVKVIEEAVSRSDYLVGGKFTAAHVYVRSHIGFGLMFGTLEKRPAFQKYWERLSARPAFARARELDEVPAKS
jgi:glutathione S-transferase